ncbi:TetR/AcrR family transcriptional regulator [Kibdelosporangium phytohabitans]|uniref:HTH tetR-type domain-containing protein n=1 Tax=Kibdelosporangium phytohabitans TaxID=860235 RepID=A0A0N9I7C2_9PSEU|nr:TetR/AcrR family transcriptional regulator [Kibdelosporangium phytohabitans]ALG10402.1 hypothetical protein AOZ06_29055 [Kibdelosporangium phytohabitans]MBE1461463.1 AcrR family transcriptional regulator [Kibdelosporangium phytohabitans]
MPDRAQRIKGNSRQRTDAHSQLRAALLTAVRELAEQAGGYESVTMRQIAAQVGYAAPVVYEYFPGKRQLLLAVTDVGFAELADRLAEAGCPKRNPRRAEANPLMAVADALWTFATANPCLYQLMHTLVDVPFGTGDTPASALRCFELLKSAVTAAAPDHPAKAQDDDAPTDLFWAQLHGVITLALHGRIKGGHARARSLLDHAATTFRDH